MGWQNQANTLLIITIAGGFSGEFVYSPAPGAGNLIYSNTAAAGTDPYGNHYLAGTSWYQSGGSLNVNNGTFLMYAGTVALGHLVAAIAPASGGTDSVGNVFPQGFNFGTWSGAGALLQHFGINTNGSTFLANSAGHTVIEEQSADGSMLFYNSSGAGLGNLIHSIAPAAGTDPAGNNYLAGETWYQSGGVINISNGVLLTYAPTAALNHLTTSIAPVGGTDTYGNLYLAGSVSYGLGGATYFAAQSNLGGFVIYSAASEAGPWTNVGGMGSDAGGDLLLNSVLANIALQPGAAQTVIVGGPTRATLASLEVEGAAALENAGLPSAVVGYAQPFASSGHLNYVAGATGDGNTYDTGRLTLEATGQLVNAAAFVPITGIGDIALGVGTYHIRGRLLAVPNVAGGSVELRFTGSGGLVTSSFAVTVREFTYPVGGGAMGFGNGQTVGLGATFTGALVGAGLAPRPIDFEGRAVVTTAGTLTPQVATTVAADTYNVAVPTDVEILPVVA